MAGLSGDGWSPPAAIRDVVEFHWFHVPVGSCLVLVALSEEPSWYVGHFEQGRMRRCRGELCRFCVDGVGRQIRYVVSAVELRTRQLGVIELGRAPMMVLRDAALVRQGLRGLIFELGRASKSKHGRMDLVVLWESPPGWAMDMEGLNVRTVLERTWLRETGGSERVSADRSGTEPEATTRFRRPNLSKRAP